MHNIDTEIEATLDILKEAGPAGPSEDLLADVLDRIESGEISRKRRSTGRMVTLAAAAIILLASLNIAYFFLPHSDNGQTDTATTSWLSEEYNLDAGSHLTLEESL